MEQSCQQQQASIGVMTQQMAYAAPAYQPASMAATGPASLVGGIPSPAQPSLAGQHQLAYQQLQHLHSQQHHQQQHQQLQKFWAIQIQEVEQTTDFRNHSLPLARIKKIMKADEDVRMISAEAPVIFAKACEMFILELTLRAWIHTEENKRRTLQKNDIAAAITRTDIFDFLVDIVPRDELKEEGIGIARAAIPAVGAPPEAIPYYYVPTQPGSAGMIIGEPVDQAASASAMYAAQQHRPVTYMAAWQQPQAPGQQSQGQQGSTGDTR